ncbi:MAG: hypothetical protein AABW81_02675 [Nanoarchaeota archaeon]
MKKIFVLCGEEPRTCEDIKFLLETEKRDNLEMTFKETPFEEDIPNGFDGYHVNINCLSIKDLKKLRENNPISLIYGTGQIYNPEDKEKNKMLNYFDSLDAWRGIKELVDRLSIR